VIVTEVVGWVGAVALLAAHGLLVTGRVAVVGRPYLLLNAGGAAALAANGAAHAAWPSAALNLLWLGIGVRAAIPRCRTRLRRKIGRRRSRTKDTIR
jgi:hypothetical protein